MFTAHHEKGSVPTFSKASIEHLVDNLESEKRNYCFAKKSLEIVLNFGSKNLHEPCDSFCFSYLRQQKMVLVQLDARLIICQIQPYLVMSTKLSEIYK